MTDGWRRAARTVLVIGATLIVLAIAARVAVTSDGGLMIRFVGTNWLMDAIALVSAAVGAWLLFGALRRG